MDEWKGVWKGGLSALEFPHLVCEGQYCMEWACWPQLLALSCLDGFQVSPKECVDGSV